MSIDKYDELHVVSDLHLGGEIKDGRNFQIFNQGERLGKFIINLAVRPVGKIGLVLNGDIVDFLAESPGCYLDTENAVRKLEHVYTDKAFAGVWKALSGFIEKPGRQLIIVLGNHDVELALPPVKAWLIDKLSGGNDERKGRITYATDGAGYACEVGNKRVLCVHGNEVDPWNVVDYFSLLKVARSLNRGRKPDPWDANAGTRLVIDVMNDIKRKYPFVDLLKPETKAAIPIVAAIDPSQASNAFKIAGLYERQSEDGTKIDRGLLIVDPNQLKKIDAAAKSEIEKLVLDTFGELDRKYASNRVADLLSSVYDDIDEGVDPKKTQDLDNELLSLGDSLDRLKDWFGRLAGNASTEELLRAALKLLLRNDDTFSFDGADETFDKLKERVGPDVHYVIAGHTHLARVKERQPGKYYYNSGTWIRLIELTKDMLNDDEVFSLIYKTIKGSGGNGSSIEDLDNLNGLGPGHVPFIKKDTTHAVSIIDEGGSACGQLCLVDENGNPSPVNNTKR